MVAAPAPKCDVSPCKEAATWRVAFHPPHAEEHSLDYCSEHARPFVRQMCSVPVTCDRSTPVDCGNGRRYGGAVDECPHGMGHPSWCSICKHGLSQATSTVPLEVDYTFAAKHEGQCRACDLPIYPGQTIAKMTDGSYRHAEGCA